MSPTENQKQTKQIQPSQVKTEDGGTRDSRKVENMTQRTAQTFNTPLYIRGLPDTGLGPIREPCPVGNLAEPCAQDSMDHSSLLS